MRRRAVTMVAAAASLLGCSVFGSSLDGYGGGGVPDASQPNDASGGAGGAGTAGGGGQSGHGGAGGAGGRAGGSGADAGDAIADAPGGDAGEDASGADAADAGDAADASDAVADADAALDASDATTDATACGDASIACDGGCVDPLGDPAHCGACGNACAPTETCREGGCACPQGQTPCGGVCVDTQTNVLHCGACDDPCGPGQVCTAGSCELYCPPPQVECGGLCVDLMTSPAHCGACDDPCGFGELCNAGQCELFCGGGLIPCGASCVDPQTDETHCGDCTTACGANQECVGGSCQISCESGLTNPIADPWGAKWDSLERLGATQPAAEGVCAALGGRLPTATELYRVSATQSAAVGQSFHTSYLWSAALHDAASQSTVRLSDGNTSSTARTSSLTYRCVCPASLPASFSGARCHGPPGAGCFALGGEGDRYNLDVQDRPELSKAGAVWECAFDRAHLASFTTIVEAILAGAPNGSGRELHTADDSRFEYSTTARWTGVASGWTVDGSSGVEELTQQYPFRCAGPGYEAGTHPNAVPGEFVGPNGGYKSESADRAATTWAAAHDACFAAGGHLPAASDLAELAQLGLPGGSDVYLWSSDQHGYNGSNFLVGTPRWSGVNLRFDYVDGSTYGWGYKTASRPLRCVWYPIDTTYGGPADSDCSGGCFALTLAGTTPARMWLDSSDRPAARLEAAFDACRLLDGHLAGERDLVEAIRHGLPNGSDTWIHTSEMVYGGGSSAGRRNNVVRWTATDLAYTDQWSTYMTWGNLTSSRPFRCVWTNELR